MTSAMARPVLPRRILGAYGDIRLSTRAEIDAPPEEGRLLFYAMLIGLLNFLVEVSIPRAGAPEDSGWVMGHFVSSLFFLPLFLYALAALAHMACRLGRGAGAGRETRVATFWALLVAQPLILGARIIGRMSDRFQGADNALIGIWTSAAGVLSVAGGVAACWIWASALAEAQGFQRTPPVFFSMMALFGAILLAHYAVRGWSE